MKKILILLVATFFSYSTISVAAGFKMPTLPDFNLPDINGTVGIGVTSNLGHAEGTEEQNDEADIMITKESGVFVDDSMGVFAELNLGDRISVGISYLADDLQTPEATNEKVGSLNTVKAAFSDITTGYVRLNVIGGFYLKAGLVEGDILTGENVTTSSQSGSTVPDQDLKGDTFGIGHMYENDAGFQLRTELMYSDYDNFKVTDTSGDIYTVTKLESLQASIWVAKAF